MLINNFINNKIAPKQVYYNNHYNTPKLSFRANLIEKNLINETRSLVNKYYEALYKDFINNNFSKNILQPKNIPEITLYNIAKSELQKMIKVPSERKLNIITGRFGSGKTTFVEDKIYKNLFYVPDSDELKPLLPGFKEKGVEFVHEASYTNNKINLFEAFKRGLNCVFQTATDPYHLDEVIKKAKQFGYDKIKLVHINVSEQNAIARCNSRATEIGRTVNPDAIKERKYIDDIVEIYKNPQKGISEIFVYDNNGPSSLLIEHSIIK